MTSNHLSLNEQTCECDFGSVENEGRISYIAEITIYTL